MEDPDTKRLIILIVFAVMGWLLAYYFLRPTPYEYCMDHCMGSPGACDFYCAKKK